MVDTDGLETFLPSLQGFWNMLIFVYHKIRIIRDNDSTIDSNTKALTHLLLSPQIIPDEMQFSGFDNVVIENKDIEENNAVIEEEEESVYTSNPSKYDGVTRVSSGPEVTKTSTPSYDKQSQSVSLFSKLFNRNDMISEEPSLFGLSSQPDASNHDQDVSPENSAIYDKSGFKRTSSLGRRDTKNS